MFGGAFQDGMSRLYDVRNLNIPLAKIKSTRPNELMGAFRCLKFSNGPEDLMFLSEQMERVHIVDLRDFDNHQVLTVPGTFSCSDYTEALTTNELAPLSTPASPPAGQSESSLSPSSPIIQSYQDVVSHHQPSRFPRLQPRQTQQSEYGLSGISWTDHNGGSVVVGTGNGIGVWKIDGWARRTFPSFTIR